MAFDDRTMSLLVELRRRNVLRMVALYLVAAWLIMQVAEVLMTLAQLPPWSGRALLGVLVIGFPIAILLSWFFELTPAGLKLERTVDTQDSIAHLTGRRLDILVISILLAALAVFAYDKWWLQAESVSLESVPRSIAVLPFVNISADPNDEYLSDGVAEEILNLLTQVPDIRVTSRTSAFSFKGQNLALPEIADRLGVAHVLEGSVQRSGDQLRITAKLIDVESDTSLWSRSFNREIRSLFAIQEEIAAAVVDALKVSLLVDRPKASRTDPAAYALYLRARHLQNLVTETSYSDAEVLLRQAVAIDGDFAPAWTQLARVYMRQANTFGVRSDSETSQLMRRAIENALRSDPEYGPAYATQASLSGLWDQDYAAAEVNVQKALELNPGDAIVMEAAAGWHVLLGDLDEAISIYREVTEVDPVSVSAYRHLSRVLFFADRLDEAMIMSRTAESLSPDGARVHYAIGLVLIAQNDASSALAEMQDETRGYWRLTGIAMAQHALGDRTASDAALAELIENWAPTSAYLIAQAYAFRGDADDAFAWLERAYETGNTGLYEIQSNSILARLRSDPRWDVFIAKMGIPGLQTRNAGH